MGSEFRVECRCGQNDPEQKSRQQDRASCGDSRCSAEKKPSSFLPAKRPEFANSERPVTVDSPPAAPEDPATEMLIRRVSAK